MSAGVVSGDDGLVTDVADPEAMGARELLELLRASRRNEWLARREAESQRQQAEAASSMLSEALAHRHSLETQLLLLQVLQPSPSIYQALKP